MIYQQVINCLLDNDAVKATKYVSPKEIVRATRKRYSGKIKKGKIEITLTIGKPNFAERKFIKDCIKSGEYFPVKKIQLNFSKK